jgi:hypothetical protein
VEAIRIKTCSSHEAVPARWRSLSADAAESIGSTQRDLPDIPSLPPPSQVPYQLSSPRDLPGPKVPFLTRDLPLPRRPAPAKGNIPRPSRLSFSQISPHLYMSSLYSWRFNAYCLGLVPHSCGKPRRGLSAMQRSSGLRLAAAALIPVAALVCCYLFSRYWGGLLTTLTFLSRSGGFLDILSCAA